MQSVARRSENTMNVSRLILHAKQMDLICCQYPSSAQPIVLAGFEKAYAIAKKSLLVPKEWLDGSLDEVAVL